MKLHLGSGQRYLKGYVHIDLADYSHINYKHNISSLPMIENESTDLIYASHVLEYFDRNEVNNILKEWRRVLKPDGILRLAVPDFVQLVEVYLKTKDLQPILGPLYGRWPILGSSSVIYHKTVYDFRDMEQLLANNGFKSIKLWNWQEVFTDENEGFDDYSQAYFPHMDKENGICISLNVEAKKI